MSRPSTVGRIVGGIAVALALALSMALPAGAAPHAASADVSVTKSDNPDPVVAGTTLHYTIVVENDGPDTASFPTLNDTIPAGTTFQSLSFPNPWFCSQPAPHQSGQVQCHITSMGSGDKDTFQLNVNVNSNVAPGTVIPNTASVQSQTPDPDTSNNDDTTHTTVSAQADLSITKTDSPDPAPQGGNIAYKLNVKNNGPSTASGIEVDDTLPPNTTFQSIAMPSGWSCTTPAVDHSGTVVCKKGSLAAGDGDTLTLTVKIDPSVKAGTVITNTATVSATTPDPKTSNNSDSAQTTVSASQADVSITKTASPSPATAGEQLQYTIAVHNNGPNAATNVTVTDAVPTGTAFVGVSLPSGWSCGTKPPVGGSGTLICSVSTMAAGDTDTLQVTVVVAATLRGGTVLTNTATVKTGSVDPKSENDSSKASVLVHRRADLSIVKLGQPHPVRPGHLIEYTLTVRNDGPSVAKRVKVTDFVGDHTVFRRVSTPFGWSCTHPSRGDTGKVRCTLQEPLGPDEIHQITIIVRVKGGTDPGTFVTNVGRVSSPTPDPSRGDHASSVTT